MRLQALFIPLGVYLLSPTPFCSLEAQTRESLILKVGAVVGGDAPFSTQDMEDAATVVLASKMPGLTFSTDRNDSAIQFSAFVVCVDLARGHTCSLTMGLGRGLAWDNPFGEDRLPFVDLWSAYHVIAGPSGEVLGQIRTVMEEELDAPVAAWLRLDEARSACWTHYLHAVDTDELWSWAVSVGEARDPPSLQAAAEFAALGGPCQQFAPSPR